jgi:hypothetical protein
MFGFVINGVLAVLTTVPGLTTSPGPIRAYSAYSAAGEMALCGGIAGSGIDNGGGGSGGGSRLPARFLSSSYAFARVFGSFFKPLTKPPTKALRRFGGRSLGCVSRPNNAASSGSTCMYSISTKLRLSGSLDGDGVRLRAGRIEFGRRGSVLARAQDGGRRLAWLRGVCVWVDTRSVGWAKLGEF